MATEDENTAAPLRRPTRDDVARLAGVSSAVVSYVINNGPRPVSPTSRQLVLDAIEQLSYKPNDIARSLAGHSTRTVGLIAPTLANPLWAEVSMGVTATLKEASYLLLMCNVEDSPQQDVEFAHLLVSKRVDGVVLVPTAETRTTIEVLSAAHVPFVVVEQDVPGAPSVVVDACRTGQVITEHLLQLGHTRIAILREHRTSLDSWMRFEGYKDALGAAGIAVDMQLVADADPSLDGSVVDGSISAAAQLLDVEPTPTAVFAHNDLMAIAVVREAKRRGLGVPEDLSVIGVDDAEAGRYSEPPLTTLPFPKRKLGRTAAAKLLDLIEGKPSDRLTTLAPPDLIVRSSTGPPAENATEPVGQRVSPSGRPGAGWPGR